MQNWNYRSRCIWGLWKSSRNPPFSLCIYIYMLLISLLIAIYPAKHMEHMLLRTTRNSFKRLPPIGVCVCVRDVNENPRNPVLWIPIQTPVVMICDHIMLNIVFAIWVCKSWITNNMFRFDCEQSRRVGRPQYHRRRRRQIPKSQANHVLCDVHTPIS